MDEMRSANRGRQHGGLVRDHSEWHGQKHLTCLPGHPSPAPLSDVKPIDMKKQTGESWHRLASHHVAPTLVEHDHCHRIELTIAEQDPGDLSP